MSTPRAPHRSHAHDDDTHNWRPVASRAWRYGPLWGVLLWIVFPALFWLLVYVVVTWR
jgi:hypothetical protein